MPSLALKANFMKSVKPAQLVPDVYQGALAGVSYSLIPSIFKLSGWTGWFAGVVGTWLIGSLFDLPGMRSGAWAVGGTHLMYTYDVVNGVLKLPQWRFNEGIYQGVSDAAPNVLQPGAQIVTLPDGSQVVSYGDQMAMGQPEDYTQQGQLPAGGEGVSSLMDYFEGQAPMWTPMPAEQVAM